MRVATRPASAATFATSAVRVTPGAKRSQLTGLADGVFRIKVAAPAVDGKANEALISFLADLMHIRPRQITISQGETSRQKALRIEAVAQAQVESLLSLPITHA